MAQNKFPELKVTPKIDKNPTLIQTCDNTGLTCEMDHMLRCLVECKWTNFSVFFLHFSSRFHNHYRLKTVIISVAKLKTPYIIISSMASMLMIQQVFTQVLCIYSWLLMPSQDTVAFHHCWTIVSVSLTLAFDHRVKVPPPKWSIHLHE